MLIECPKYLVFSGGWDTKAVLVEVFMPTIRMASVNKSVNRTVTLPAWLDAVAKEKGINCSRLLQDSLIQHLDSDVRL